MKPRVPFFTLILTFLLLLAIVPTQSSAANKQLLYIGIEKNRLPYTDLAEKKQAQGILISVINHLCEVINAECEFVIGEFDQLFQDLQTYQLHGLMVTDSIILPEFDKLKLTPPLCKVQPVFIQKRQDNSRTKPDDFKGAIIGVRHASLLHLYLLENYSSQARLKPFPLLESGVFDLVTGRIEILATHQAFFMNRLQKTPLGKEYKAIPLEILQTDETMISPISMTLALKEQNADLYALLTQAIQENGQPPFCADLLLGQKQSGASAPPLSVNFAVTMPAEPALEIINPAADKPSQKN